MKDIRLADRIIEAHEGGRRNQVRMLLKKQREGKGIIPSVAELMFSGIEHFRSAPRVANTDWNTSTMSVIMGDEVIIIPPYESGSRTLTDTARHALSLFEYNEKLSNHGVSLGVDDRMFKLGKNGGPVLHREDFSPFGEDLTLDQALEYLPILINLGDPRYVGKKFWRVAGDRRKSINEVNGLIREIYELGEKNFGFSKMMPHYLPKINGKGILNTWLVGSIGNKYKIVTGSSLNDKDGYTAFDRLTSGRMKSLTSDTIYSVIEGFVAPGSEGDARRALDNLVGDAPKRAILSLAHNAQGD